MQESQLERISSSTSSSSSICNKSLERKVRKPKIEKLRRARINTSLEQLKDILLRNTIWKHTQGSRPTKLEKADILEMTIVYIEMLHNKLSTQKSSSSLSSKSRGKSTMETVKAIHCEALHDISNQMNNNLNEKNNRQVQVASDERSLMSSPSSLWYYNRFSVHQRSSNSNTNNSDNFISDKENFVLNKMRQFNENLSSISTTTSTAQQSIFSSSFERHWRPW